ncbi:unnamed protein product [Toxocara canis]|uniref:Transposase n=1 Tax=Toxocara canis TaxID=6265 RepID=A0A183UYI9_TOXCA|nr:unnamed protein product [Toxocara canis]
MFNHYDNVIIANLQIDDYFITGYLGHKINVTFDNIRPLQATKEKFLERKALFWWVNKGDMREAKKLWNKLELSYEVEQAVKKALKESRQNCNGTSSTTIRPAPK